VGMAGIRNRRPMDLVRAKQVASRDTDGARDVTPRVRGIRGQQSSETPGPAREEMGCKRFERPADESRTSGRLNPAERLARSWQRSRHSSRTGIAFTCGPPRSTA
jgi:hypothetical protein